jgi:DNA excision repair protein ERCC-2
MNEAERDEFLAKFTNGSAAVGLAVLGGIFSEGIDLPGKQLVGVIIIGVGLPGLSIERDLLAAYFDQQGKSGFDYAYRFPGMQRVLQAAGRLIRSEDDRGSALLIDRRYLETRYERLFPSWWKVETIA